MDEVISYSFACNRHVSILRTRWRHPLGRAEEPNDPAHPLGQTRAVLRLGAKDGWMNTTFLLDDGD